MLEEASHNELNRKTNEIKQTRPKASNFFLPISKKPKISPLRSKQDPLKP